VTESAKPWAVTGAAGYLGSYVVEQLLARGTPVLAADDLSTGRAEHLRRSVSGNLPGGWPFA